MASSDIILDMISVSGDISSPTSLQHVSFLRYLDITFLCEFATVVAIITLYNPFRLLNVMVNEKYNTMDSFPSSYNVIKEIILDRWHKALKKIKNMLLSCIVC